MPSNILKIFEDLSGEAGGLVKPREMPFSPPSAPKPVVATTPGGPIRAPAAPLAVGGIAAAYLGMQPDQAQAGPLGTGSSKIFETFNSLMSKMDKSSPSWATKTDMPMTAFSKKEQQSFEFASVVLKNVKNGMITPDEAVKKLKSANVPQSELFKLLWDELSTLRKSPEEPAPAPVAKPAKDPGFGIKTDPKITFDWGRKPVPLQESFGIKVPSFSEQYDEFKNRPSPLFTAKPDVDFSPYKKVGEQLGSNPGGTYVDPQGQQWYLKSPSTTKYGGPKGSVRAQEIVANEMLANELYRVAGSRVPEMQLGKLGGDPAIASKMIDLKSHPDEFDKVIPHLQKDFAIDAWLANWDVAGLGLDNVIFDPKNPENYYRIDQGGALAFRAQGQPKNSYGLPFTSDAQEVWTLRGLKSPSIGESGKDSIVNPQAAKVFGNMTDEQLRESAHRLEAVNPFMIAEAVQRFGPKDPNAVRNLTNLLLRRRANIIAQLDPKYSTEEELTRYREQIKNTGQELFHGGAPASQWEGSGLQLTGEAGFWMTPDRDLAKMYGGKNVHELVAKTSDFLRYDAQGKVYSKVNDYVMTKAREGFYPGLIIDNIYDAPSGMHSGPPKTVVIALDPVLVRRKEAKFDPAKMSLNDLLASGAGIMVTGGVAAALSGVPVNEAQAAPWDFRFMPGVLKKAEVLGKSGYRIEPVESAGRKDEHAFNIVLPDGKPGGQIVTRAGTPKDPTQLYIKGIDSEKGAGSIGPEGMRDIEQQLRAVFPDASSIGGNRITGAREKTGKIGAAKMPLAAAGGAAALGGDDQAQAEPIGQSDKPKNLTEQAAMEKRLREEGMRRLVTGQSEFPDDYDQSTPLARETKKQFTEGIGSAAEGASALMGDEPAGELPTIVTAGKQKGIDFVLDRIKHSMKTGEDLDFGELAPTTAKEKRDWQQFTGGAEMVGGVVQTIASPATGALLTMIDELPYKQEFKDTLKQAAIFFAPMGGMGAIGKVKNLVQSLSKTSQAVKATTIIPMQKLLSPQSVSKTAEDTAAIIRERTGIGARYTELTRAALGDDPTKSTLRNLFENSERKINDLGPNGQLDFLKYIEGRSKGAMLVDPQVQGVADEIRHAMTDRKDRLQNIPKHAQAQFIEDYIAHFWEDKTKARQFAQWWMQKQPIGTSAKGHLKKRSIPTIEEGMSYGLKPITTNPIDIAMRYVEQMDRYIAHQEILDAMETAGHLRWMPEGSPQIPDGWAPLRGKWSQKGDLVGVAPEDAARVYNRFASQGFKGEFARPAYEAVQATGNAVTAMELGLSAFHLSTMNMEAPISLAATAAAQAAAIPSKVAKGQLRDALQLLKGASRRMGEAVATPLAGAAAGGAVGGPAGAIAGLMLSGGIPRVIRGHKFQQVYLGRSPVSASPALRHIVNLHTAAGGRAVGKGHTLREYQFSPGGSFFSQWKRAGLKGMGSQLKTEFQRNPAKAFVNQFGKILETVSQPIFEVYIPKLKDGAFYDAMRGWLEANPTASIDEQMVVARKLVDSMDNRFGEMVQDNIFWNKMAKQLAMVGMRSYSWNMGTVREIGGGFAKGISDSLSLSITNKRYDPRVGYVIALPIISGLMGAVYHYLKTEQTPGDGTPEGMLRDMMVPRTGGEVAGVGGRGSVEERAQLPGYMRDVFGWFHDWQGEAANKMATGPRLAIEGVQGKDWRGDPIVRPEATAPEWLQDYFTWLFGGSDPQLGPISVRNLMRGEKTGSGLTVTEQFLGIRPASAYMQDPEGMERAKWYGARKAQKVKERHIRQRERAYGPEE